MGPTGTTRHKTAAMLLVVEPPDPMQTDIISPQEFCPLNLLHALHPNPLAIPPPSSRITG